jgi:hypothetical protein
MDNNELARRDMAAKKYESMRGKARREAIVEERRKIEEYTKQRRLLFPSTEDIKTKSKSKGKQQADSDPINPVPLTQPNLTAPITSMQATTTTSPSPAAGGRSRLSPLDAAKVSSSSSTEGPAITSGHRTPASSTSTPPPPLEPKNKQRTWRTKTEEKPTMIPISSGKYRVRAIPPWFLVDRSCTAYATPVPDLKHVMELGVWHLASTTP